MDEDTEASVVEWTSKALDSLRVLSSEFQKWAMATTAMATAVGSAAKQWKETPPSHEQKSKITWAWWYRTPNGQTLPHVTTEPVYVCPDYWTKGYEIVAWQARPFHDKRRFFSRPIKVTAGSIIVLEWEHQQSDRFTAEVFVYLRNQQSYVMRAVPDLVVGPGTVKGSVEISLGYDGYVTVVEAVLSDHLTGETAVNRKQLNQNVGKYETITFDFTFTYTDE